jgi:hypothetical protein
MWPGQDRLALDHTDEGDAYLGFSHDSPCTICGQRCNSAAGGRHRARNAGQNLRERNCVICGQPYRASTGTGGSKQVTCARRQCITELRRLRHDRKADPEPPPVKVDGRAWLLHDC